jgi:hypothetical protein
MRFVNLPYDSSTLLSAYKYKWLRENRGLLSEVADKLHVSRQFVAQVYWGIRSSRRVENALRRRGACLCGAHGTKVRPSRRRGNV